MLFPQIVAELMSGRVVDGRGLVTIDINYVKPLGAWYMVIRHA